jgi:hypothetical protein
MRRGLGISVSEHDIASRPIQGLRLMVSCYSDPARPARCRSVKLTIYVFVRRQLAATPDRRRSACCKHLLEHSFVHDFGKQNGEQQRLFGRLQDHPYNRCWNPTFSVIIGQFRGVIGAQTPIGS